MLCSIYPWEEVLNLEILQSSEWVDSSKESTVLLSVVKLSREVISWQGLQVALKVLRYGLWTACAYTLSWFVSYRRISSQFQFSMSAVTLVYLHISMVMGDGEGGRGQEPTQCTKAEIRGLLVSSSCLVFSNLSPKPSYTVCTVGKDLTLTLFYTHGLEIVVLNVKWWYIWYLKQVMTGLLYITGAQVWDFRSLIFSWFFTPLSLYGRETLGLK
jgi:hypothetical protein